MRTQHDLDEAFRDLKRDDGAPPLMSRENITALLTANPIAANPMASSPAPRVTTVRSTRTPWLVGGSLALAATVALVVVNTSVDDTVSTSVPQSISDAQKQSMQVETSPTSTDLAAATRKDAAEEGPSGGLNGTESASADGSGATSPRLEIATIRLTAAQLAPFGLTYAGGSISYIEDAVRVTIRANGVATKQDASTNDAATKLDASAKDVATLTPTMVVVYHDEAHFASWYDRTNPELVNGLIAIRVPLDAANVLAKKVDVVLWFPGTREVAERLPEQYRRQLLGELGLAQQTIPTPQYTQPDQSGSSLIRSSLVFPNPLRTGMASIRIQMKRTAVCTGIITDMFGREIATAWKSQSVSEGQTDLPLFGLDNAPTGVYNVLVTFEGSQERIVQRLMIQR